MVVFSCIGPVTRLSSRNRKNCQLSIVDDQMTIEILVDVMVFKEQYYKIGTPKPTEYVKSLVRTLDAPLFFTIFVKPMR